MRLVVLLAGCLALCLHSPRAGAAVDYQQVLCIESQEGSIRNVEGALHKGADPTQSCDSHFADRTPLHRAADRGHVEIIKLLFQHGAKAVLDRKDNSGRTALLHAAENGHHAAVREILAAGAKPDDDTNAKGQTALLVAARRGFAGTVEALLEFGADVNQRDSSGSTALMWAAQAGVQDCVDVLLEHGADVNATNDKRQTALLLAATTTEDQHYMLRPSLAMEHDLCVESLIKAGANLDHQTKEGNSALMSAARWSNSTKILKALINSKANMNLQDKLGRTALMFAAYMDFKEGIKLLIESGCDWQMANHDGWTAETITIERGHKEARQLFNLWRYHGMWDLSGHPQYQQYSKEREVPPEVRALWENQDEL